MRYFICLILALAFAGIVIEEASAGPLARLFGRHGGNRGTCIGGNCRR